MQLCDAGKVHLEDSLFRWFPEIDRARDISLRRLLNHTAGIPDYGSLPHYHAAVGSSPSTETVSGQTFAQVLTERVFRPLHLTGSVAPETVEDLRSLAPAMSRAIATDRSIRDTRLHYHPGWVSHGVVASTPSEIARFFDALFAGRLLSNKRLAAMTELVPEISPVDGGTRFEFDLGAVLRVRTFDDPDHADLWSLYKPDGRVLAVRGDGMFSLAEGNVATPTFRSIPQKAGSRQRR